MFQARSVVGGYWMRVFVERFLAGDLTGVEPIERSSFDTQNVEEIYDLQGRKWQAAPKGIYIKNGKKYLNK